jgi:hypothetical protein
MGLRPSFWPRLLAARRPAQVRSTINDRSNSASAPSYAAPWRHAGAVAVDGIRQRPKLTPRSPSSATACTKGRAIAATGRVSRQGGYHPTWAPLARGLAALVVQGMAPAQRPAPPASRVLPAQTLPLKPRTTHTTSNAKISIANGTPRKPGGGRGSPHPIAGAIDCRARKTTPAINSQMTAAATPSRVRPRRQFTVSVSGSAPSAASDAAHRVHSWDRFVVRS